MDIASVIHYILKAINACYSYYLVQYFMQDTLCTPQFVNVLTLQ